MRFLLATAAVLLPLPAQAHDAFGDLGPFYANLLHPLADPAQGLLLAAVAVLLARQPLASVRPAWAALLGAGGAGILATASFHVAQPTEHTNAFAAMALGLPAITGWHHGGAACTALGVAVGVFAALAIDLPADGRAAGLSVLGGTLGIGLIVLLIWGAVDFAIRRVGPVAGAVAGSWIAAIGLISVALPA